LYGRALRGGRASPEGLTSFGGPAFRRRRQTKRLGVIVNPAKPACRTK
jgi:hypothetical protein